MNWRLCVLFPPFCILLLVPCFNNAYYITNNINKILESSERDPFVSQTSLLVNDSKRDIDNSNEKLSDDVWANEGQFTETYFDVLESFTGNSVWGRSTKNYSKRSASDHTLEELKSLLEKKLRAARNYKREATPDDKNIGKSLHRATQRSASSRSTRGATQWDEWTPWSSCSVSCGKGRHIRWRNCKENCEEAETEMEEKSCQLPACPQKLFGLINL